MGMMHTNLLQPFYHPLCTRAGVAIDLLRLDLIDPTVSGNKWFKLMPLLELLDGSQPILSFGGAYSNHLHALARLGYKQGFRTIGVIRGEPQQTPTTEDLELWGMKLHFVSRSDYRQKNNPEFIRALQARFGQFFLLPEGGANEMAIQGCSDIWSLVGESYRPNQVFVSVGTGTTLAGLAVGAPSGTKLTGICASGGFDYLEAQIKDSLKAFSLNEDVSWCLESACNLRFAKVDTELSALWQRLSQLDLQLDPVYTLRLFHSIVRKLHRGVFSPGQRILLVHTGGLQGVRGQQLRLNRLASAHCGPVPL